MAALYDIMPQDQYSDLLSNLSLLKEEKYNDIIKNNTENLVKCCLVDGNVDLAMKILYDQCKLCHIVMCPGAHDIRLCNYFMYAQNTTLEALYIDPEDIDTEPLFQQIDKFINEFIDGYGTEEFKKVRRDYVSVLRKPISYDRDVVTKFLQKNPKLGTKHNKNLAFVMKSLDNYIKNFKNSYDVTTNFAEIKKYQTNILDWYHENIKKIIKVVETNCVSEYSKEKKAENKKIIELYNELFAKEQHEKKFHKFKIPVIERELEMTDFDE